MLVNLSKFYIISKNTGRFRGKNKWNIRKFDKIPNTGRFRGKNKWNIRKFDKIPLFFLKRGEFLTFDVFYIFEKKFKIGRF